jgi:mRNA interferase MazF
MELLRGHVYRVNLEPVLGHEQHGEARPVVVLSKDVFNRRRGTVIVVPLGTSARLAPPAVISVPSIGASSVALCEQVRCLDKQRFQREIGVLSTEDLVAVEQSVAAILGLTQ